MDEKKQIVVVNANFTQGDALFGLLKKYSQYADDRFVYWDEFAFTAEKLPETDALLVFNQPSGRLETICDPGKSIAFMMEPGDPYQNPWMFRQQDQYAKVYSPLHNSPNTVLSHGYIGWLFDYGREFLSGMGVPEKTNDVSCIASTLTQLKGHRNRTRFVNLLRKRLPAIDFFGKGTRYLHNKMDGLLSYRYSIAIENASMPFYFTEKINDCFLSYTVPLYYGCKNIGKFFPERSFIRIDIDDQEKAIRQIERCLFENDWRERLTALQEARELVLNKYQPLAGAAAVLREIQTAAEKKKMILMPVSTSLRKRIANKLMQLTNRQANHPPAMFQVKNF
jgi:hypothetical protein